MTLDRLATSMQRELLGVGRKFDTLDGKIDRMRVVQSLDESDPGRMIHCECLNKIAKILLDPKG